ncbi:MAG TPA: hypothetical protein DCY20_05580 [Firmicutes bacterium]|nr:hypothetical protein [Bacillota bacterium]
MGLFNNQLQHIIEWNETRDDLLFWMWRSKEIKKGSRLIIRPGQDAIFLYNGKVEGVFTDEGNYEIESEIIPFLTSLKGFKFGFNTPLRAEVLFINTKEFLVRWGTKNAINISTPTLKGGLPVRSFGTFSVKIDDHQVLIDRIAGVKQQFSVDDVKERAISMLDQLLMRWISKEGKDLFNLQGNAYEIAGGIRKDLDMELIKVGLTVTDFKISSFTYPENVQAMIEKNASYEMVSDLEKYQKVSLIDAVASNSNSQMASLAQAGVGMAMGMEMMKQMSGAMSQGATQLSKLQCVSCHSPLPTGAKFCTECGMKVASVPPTTKFCPECGSQVESLAKFCNACGLKLN